MTKEEFRARVEEFWSWTAQYDRSPTAWFSSLSDWSKREFNREYDKQYPKES